MKHFLVVMANPTEGGADQLRSWYRSIHLEDMSAVPGVKVSRLYEVSDHPGEGLPSPYQFLVLYEVPDESLEEARAALQSAKEQRASMRDTGTSDPRGTDALAEGHVSAWFDLAAQFPDE